MTDYDQSLPCQLGGSTSWFSIIESKIGRQDHTSWQSIRIPAQPGRYLSLFCGEIIMYNKNNKFPNSLLIFAEKAPCFCHISTHGPLVHDANDSTVSARKAISSKNDDKL